MSELNPEKVLELDTYCGYSTVRIARLLPPGARLITLEFNADYAAIARQVIAWAGLEDKVRTCSSTNTLFKYTNLGIFFLVVYILKDKTHLLFIMRRANALLHQIQLVEGASEDWIPRMKEHFGIETFDFVFLDHWKDRYLPDTKLMEVCLILTNLTQSQILWFLFL